MKFIKTRNVKSPERDLENAGIDCFVPENDVEFQNALLLKNAKLVVLDSSETMFDFVVDHSNKHDSFFDIKTGTFYIAPHGDVIIPSGIHSKFDKSLALIANNKSGIATKRKLTFGASVIDSGYQGEWHFHLINTSDVYQKVACGDKIIQFIPHVISTDSVEVLDMTAEEFYANSDSKRGAGWAGSTGTK